MDNTRRKKYVPIQELETYKLARGLSRLGWDIYTSLDWPDKKIMGDQFIKATDSHGANLTEGYARYHYLDKIKFYYDSRGSLSEANDYWIELLKERNKIKEENYNQYKTTAKNCSIKLQNMISGNYKAKNNHKK